MNTILTTLDEIYAKEKSLKTIKTDRDNWEIYYVDEKTGEKWIKEYPHSEYNGGGIPQLRLLDKFPWE